MVFKIANIKLLAAPLLVVSLSACSYLSFKTLNTPATLLENHKVFRDIAYGNKAYQKLDFYVPNKNTKQKLIVFIYGGGWTMGRKEQYYFSAEAFTREGYAVAIADYIKYPEGTFPSFVEDIALALSWLERHKENYSKADELIIIGHSAGAHIGALLITDPRYLRKHGLTISSIDKFVGIAGPYGFIPKEERYKNVFNHMKNYDVMRPIMHVTGKEPSMLLLHGEKDEIVAIKNTTEFADKVNQTGGKAKFKSYEKLGHIDIIVSLSRIYDFKNQVKREILTFLEQ